MTPHARDNPAWSGGAPDVPGVLWAHGSVGRVVELTIDAGGLRHVLTIFSAPDGLASVEAWGRRFDVRWAINCTPWGIP